MIARFVAHAYDDPADGVVFGFGAPYELDLSPCMSSLVGPYAIRGNATSDCLLAASVIPNPAATSAKMHCLLAAWVWKPGTAPDE